LQQAVGTLFIPELRRAAAAVCTLLCTFKLEMGAEPGWPL